MQYLDDEGYTYHGRNTEGNAVYKNETAIATIPSYALTKYHIQHSGTLIDFEDLHPAYKKIYDNQAPIQLKPWQQMALEDYKGSHGTGKRRTTYQAINTYLRTGKGFSAAVKEAVYGIDSVLAKRSIPEDTLLYRASGIPVSQFKVGTTFVDKGYVSTSADKEVNRELKGETPGAHFIISVPKGTRATIFTSAGGPAYTDEEQEVLLPRGSSFKVTGIKGNEVSVTLVKGSK